jgi:hypothetical protein
MLYKTFMYFSPMLCALALWYFEHYTLGVIVTVGLMWFQQQLISAQNRLIQSYAKRIARLEHREEGV